MNTAQTIPCPVPECNGSIVFDPYMLLRGGQFGCATCGAVIKLPTESKGVLQETMDKFDQLRTDMQQMKDTNNMS